MLLGSATSFFCFISIKHLGGLEERATGPAFRNTAQEYLRLERDVAFQESSLSANAAPEAVVSRPRGICLTSQRHLSHVPEAFVSHPRGADKY